MEKKRIRRPGEISIRHLLTGFNHIATLRAQRFDFFKSFGQNIENDC